MLTFKALNGHSPKSLIQTSCGVLVKRKHKFLLVVFWKKMIVSSGGPEDIVVGINKIHLFYSTWNKRPKEIRSVKAAAVGRQSRKHVSQMILFCMI